MRLCEFHRRAFLSAGLGAAMAPLAACAHEAPPGDPLIAAFNYAFPIFEFARTAAAAAAPTPDRATHRFNQILHRRTLADHTNRIVTTPNNDTVYSSARLDLTNGPVLAEFPTLSDRYFSVAFMNAYTDNFAYIGTRATGGAGGRALIVGPTWQGTAPNNTRLVRSATQDVWMLARILVAGPDDLAAATAAQEQIKFIQAPAPAMLGVAPSDATDPENLIAVVNAMLARAPLTDPVGARAKNFAAFGLRPGETMAWRSMSPDLQSRWRAAIPKALAHLREGFTLGGETVAGWRYPPPGAGAPGDADDVRAAVALSGLAALEQAEATYMRAQNDAGGAALIGANRYRLAMPADIPRTAFWSVSVYEIEPDGRLFFTDNPLRRYSIGDRTPGLSRSAGGGVTIALQTDDPQDAALNWLPTPKGDFALVFRAYIPDQAIVSGAWRLPPVTRA